MASIERISVKEKEWPNLIMTLCNACDSNEIEFKLSSIKTLGLIWDSISKDNFTESELVLMENTIIKILLSPSSSLELSYESIKAYQNFMKYISNRFSDKDYLQNTLKMMTTFCDVKKYNIDIGICALHLISDIIVIAYEYMDTMIDNIIEFIGILCNGENEQIAVQGYIVLIDLGQEEERRINNDIIYNKYLNLCWNNIWKIIQGTLNSGINISNEDSEFNKCQAVSLLLLYISKICDDKMINDIFLYISENLKSQNISNINSAVFIFGSILESNLRLQLKKVLFILLPKICEYFGVQDKELNLCLSWCIGEICINFGEYIVKNSNLSKILLSTIIFCLKSNDISLKVKEYLCKALFSLTEVVKGKEISNLGVFSPFLLEFLVTLDLLAYMPYEESNLSRYCFIAISGLIKCSPEFDGKILEMFLDKLYERFNEACDEKKFKNREIQEQIQSFLCIILQSFCTGENKAKLTYQKIEQFFSKIEEFFIKRGIFEEGLEALAKLSLLISNKEFSKLLKTIMEHIFSCFKEYQDFSNCKSALLCLIDLIHTSNENFIPYIPKLLEYFQDITKKPDANKELFTFFLIIYAELFEFVGEGIWQYVQVPLEYMNYVLKFCIESFDKYLSEGTEKEEMQYYYTLNNNVMDLISNILKRISKETNERKQAFYQYAVYIIQYMNFIFQKDNFIPDNDYILLCIGALLDIIDLYKNYDNGNILNLIDNNMKQKISKLAEDTKDPEIINLNKALQNYLNTSYYTMKLNLDDIF